MISGSARSSQVARFPDDEDEEMLEAYRAGNGVDAIGGAEAIISHLITKASTPNRASIPRESTSRAQRRAHDHIAKGEHPQSCLDSSREHESERAIVSHLVTKASAPDRASIHLERAIMSHFITKASASDRASIHCERTKASARLHRTSSKT